MTSVNSSLMRRWKWAERVLLLLCVACSVWHFGRQMGQISGFDSGDFLQRVHMVGEGKIDPDLRSSFWAYHPPLAFLFAYWVQTIGKVSDVVAIQLVTLASSIVALLGLRAAVRRWNLLETVAGIVFVYGVSVVPIVVHSSASLNMDMLILAYASLVLACSVRLWGTEKPPTIPVRAVLGSAIVALIVCALFTKFSGLLLTTIPVLVSLQSVDPRKRWQQVGLAVGLVLLPVCIAAPYYYHRYYRPMGTFFPNVNEWWYTAQLQQDRARRDADRIGFLAALVSPSPVVSPPDVNHRDRKVVRLVDTWRDLWFKDEELGPTSRQAVAVGRVYAWIAGIGMLIGVLAALHRWRKHRPEDAPWRRLGGVVLPFGGLLLVGLMYFIYQQPIADVIPGKGIYILPITWSFSYLIASAFPAEPKTLKPYHFAVFPLIVFGLLIDTLVPVY